MQLVIFSWYEFANQKYDNPNCNNDYIKFLKVIKFLPINQSDGKYN